MRTRLIALLSCVVIVASAPLRRSSYRDPPRHARAVNWKAFGSIAAVVLLAGAGALAYFAYARTHATAGDGAPVGSAAHATVLSLGVVSGAPAVPVETAIRLAGANGLGSASLTLTYDPKVVTLADVRNGNVPQSALTWRHDPTTGTLIMLLTTSLAKGATADGTLATVTLLAKDGAVGEVSPLALSVRHAARADGAAVTVEAASGSFRNGVPGDVTGNGLVDHDDYERLANWLVGEPVSIVELNADLDADGKVTDADAVRLHQMLDASD